MITSYFAKQLYLIGKQKGVCPIAKAHGKGAFAKELHHRLHKTKVNKRLYPIFIDSIWNLIAVDHDNHMMHGSFGKISVLEAEKREAFLRRHPVIAAAINMEGADVMYL